METIRVAEYKDAKRVMDTLDKYSYDYYIKYDFNIDALTIEEIRFYIFEFQILFFISDDDTNMVAVKLPSVYEKQNIIEILVTSIHLSFLKEAVKVIKGYSNEFGWNCLRISLVNESIHNELVEELKRIGFFKVATLSSICEEYTRTIYEIRIGEVKDEN